MTQCVVEFEQQYYSPDDLTLFFEQMGLPTNTPVTVIGTSPSVCTVDVHPIPLLNSCLLGSGPNYPDQPGGEANLDIQYIMGVAPGTLFIIIASPFATALMSYLECRRRHDLLVDLCQLDDRDR